MAKNSHHLPSTFDMSDKRHMPYSVSQVLTAAWWGTLCQHPQLKDEETGLKQSGTVFQSRAAS